MVGSDGAAGRTPGLGWGEQGRQKGLAPQNQGKEGTPKPQAGGQNRPGLPRDAPAPSTKVQPAAGLSAARGRLLPPRGLPGPRGEAGRARTWLRRNPSPPRFALLPCRGRAGGLGSHFCVCRASRDGPSLNIVTARVATCERGEGGGGAASTTAPQLRERAGMEQPLPRPRPHSPAIPQPPPTAPRPHSPPGDCSWPGEAASSEQLLAAFPLSRGGSRG